MRVVVTGGTGFLGSNLVPCLNGMGHEVTALGQEHYDLRYWDSTCQAIPECDVVIHLAALVAGIGENERRQYDFFYDNLRINANVIERCVKLGVPLVAIGSACCYPVALPSPLAAKDYMTGLPEPTNAGYAWSKRAMLAQLEAAHKQHGLTYRHPIFSNLYGPHDHYGLETAHVIPATIEKMRTQRDVTMWGDGSAIRDFLYVEDAADHILSLVENVGDYPRSHNVSSGDPVSMRMLANLIAGVCGFTGSIAWNAGKPSGSPARWLDGYRGKTSLLDGLREAVADYDSRR